MVKLPGKKMRMVVGITAFALALIFFLLQLNKNKNSPIKIGLVTTLTGPASTAGINTRNGALFAIEQANARGGINGRRVMPIIRDDKADVAEALKVDKELIKEGVVAFLGHYLSSVSVKVVPLMTAHNILMLSLGAATGDLYGLDDSFVRITLPNNIRTPMAARETYKRLGVRKVAIVCDLYNAAYTRSVLDMYSAEFQRLGGEIVLKKTFNSNDFFDASDIAKQLVASGADGIFLITDALHGAILCQHLRRQNRSIPIIACAWAACVPEFILNGGKAVEGVVSVVESDDNSTNPTYIAFKKSYQKRFGQTPSLHARDAYEITNMLLKTLEKTSVAKELKTQFLKLQSFEGTYGAIGVDRYGEPIRPVYLMQIQNGKRQVIATLSSNQKDQ